MKIVFLDKSTVGDLPAIDRLRDFGHLTCYDTTPGDKTIERIRDAEIVITNKVLIDQEVINQAPKLRLVCIAATGMNNIDLEYAKEKGIIVKNVAGYSTNSVVQATFGMIFYLLGHIKYYHDYVVSGRYSRSPIFTHHGKTIREISGKVFGIIGLGTIGSQVAQIATAFGASVSYYSTSGKNNNPLFERSSLESLLSRSDILSIHAPLTESTRYLIGYDELIKMKRSSILINAGRGGIVKEADLAKALDENLIAGAGLDVLEAEPIKSESPLLTIRNKDKLLILPHIAWASLESRELLIGKIYSNIKSFADSWERGDF